MKNKVDQKNYFSSREIKELLHREIQRTVWQRLKGDLLGISIIFAALVFFGVITYFLVEWLKLKISLPEFLILYLTFFSFYVALGYLFTDLVERGRIVREHDPYSFFQKLTNWMAAIGILFFPANMVISLLKDMTIAFRYSEQELVLISKVIVFLRNYKVEKAKISFYELRKILKENVTDINVTDQGLRKTINFLYKNGLIKIERKKEKMDPEGKNLFIEFDEKTYQELFDFLMESNPLERNEEEVEEKSV